MDTHHGIGTHRRMDTHHGIGTHPEMDTHHGIGTPCRMDTHHDIGLHHEVRDSLEGRRGLDESDVALLWWVRVPLRACSARPWVRHPGCAAGASSAGMRMSVAAAMMGV
jgi:hypothetical protein